MATKIRIIRFGDWRIAKEVFQNAKLVKAVEDGMVDGLKKSAPVIQRNIKKGIRQGRSEWPKLHPFTIAQKGSARPLIDKGSLMRAVKVDVESRKQLFIGIERGSRGSKGQDLALIANVHESGATIRVTEKMRGFLRAKGLFLRDRTKVIRIPARPFIEPAVNESVKEVKDLMIKSIRRRVERAIKAKVRVF